MKNIDAIKAMDDEQLATLFSIIMSNTFNGVDKHIYFCGIKGIEKTPHEHYRDLFKNLLNEEDSLHKFFNMFDGGEKWCSIAITVTGGRLLIIARFAAKRPLKNP